MTILCLSKLKGDQMKTKFLLSALAFASVCAFANQSVQTAPVAPQQAYPYPPANYQVPQHYFQGLPPTINTQIQKLYPGAFIVDVDYEAYGYEIKLNNYMELYFDRNGNLLGQKWDD